LVALIFIHFAGQILTNPGLQEFYQFVEPLLERGGLALG
jgi:hypothetical protein